MKTRILFAMTLLLSTEFALGAMGGWNDLRPEESSVETIGYDSERYSYFCRKRDGTGGVFPSIWDVKIVTPGGHIKESRCYGYTSLSDCEAAKGSSCN